MSPQTVRTAAPDNFPSIAALIEVQSLSPTTHCVHSASGDSIDSLISEMNTLFAAGEMAWAIALDDGGLFAALGAEFDPNRRRAWLRGPFAEHSWDAVTPMLWSALRAAISPHVDRFDSFLNVANSRGRSFYAAQGFLEKGFAHVYEAAAEAYQPTQSAPQAVVRLMSAQDLEAFAALHDSVFPTTFFSGAQIAAQIDEQHRVWVAELNGRVQGYLYGVVEPWAADGYVEFLGVAPEARGKGLGSALLQTALDWFFQSMGVATAGLTVDDLNSTARGLYERCGFRLRYSGVNQRLETAPDQPET